MKYYFQYGNPDLYDLYQPLSGLNIRNRQAKLAYILPRGRIESEYNKCQRKAHNSVVTSITL